MDRRCQGVLLTDEERDEAGRLWEAPVPPQRNIQPANLAAFETSSRFKGRRARAVTADNLLNIMHSSLQMCPIAM